MKLIFTLLPGFGLAVSFGRRLSISGADGWLKKNDFFLALIVRLSDPGGHRQDKGSSCFSAGDPIPSPAP
jgi:hypothetical protein